MSRLNLHVPDELHARFKAVCALERTDMSDVVRKLIMEYVEKAEKKLKK
jgi:metal-responsive CopG/Arc/MetJ family transcriptional regulator